MSKSFLKSPIAILDGDKRLDWLYELFKQDGYQVSRKLSAKQDVVIGSIPCKMDAHQASEIFSEMQKNGSKLFIAGAIKGGVFAEAKKYSVNAADVLDMEDVAIYNAISTAEGAIQVAMENSEITLFGSRCLVLGYGRCGKILANTLKGIGAKVTVEARKPEDEAYIKSFGLGFLHLNNLDSELGEYDFIFNTVPAMMLDESRIYKISKDCLIIDISSQPGGINFDAARQMGIRAFLSLGLPGKAAPKSAAQILKTAMEEIIADYS